MAELDLPERLRNELRNPVTDDVFEPGNIGDEIRAQVVAVERGPEARVLGALELRVERAQLGEGFVKLALVGGGGVDEVEGEVELRRGEVGHGHDEGVGDDLILETVGVELVPVLQSQRLVRQIYSTVRRCMPNQI